MDAWEYFKGLFKKSEESTAANPFMREAIERTETESADYELWKRTRSRDQMLAFINQQYANSLIEPERVETTAIDFINSASTKGFVMYFSERRDSLRDFCNLFDYLRERVLELGYVSYMSDERTYNKDLWVETIQRHYMKPSQRQHKSENPDKFVQLYGNVMIELFFRNNELANLKFRATSYNDHKFEEAHNFSDLMRAISKI
jgi:hypothetical protein